MSQVQVFDLSGALQTATTWLTRQPNELEDTENLRYDRDIGSAERRLGYSLFNTLATNKLPLGFFEAKFTSGVKIFYAYNNTGDTNTVLSCYDPVTTSITVVKSDYPPNCKLQMVMNAGELYVAGITTDTSARQQIINIQSNLTVSTTRNLFGSPKAAFIGENSGALYAMNVDLGGTVYPDRAYVSSPQRGAITYVNAAMSNTYAPIDLVNKIPAMTNYSVPSGTAAASTEFDTNWRAWQPFSRTNVRTGGSWFTASGTVTGWISYDFGSGSSNVINYYSIRGVPLSGADVNDPGAAPKTWTFEGSNNNTTWTTLDTQTNAPAWAAGEERIYKTSNTTVYRYYRVNISVNQGFPTYTGLNGVSMFSSVQTTSEMQIKLDSARYVKVGMVIDIYQAGTNNKTYTITPTSVDKSKDTVNFLPYNLLVSSVNTTNDTVTVSSSTLFPTGTPIIFTSTGAVPTGLTANTTYYAINDGSNDLKVAGTLSDAKIGAKIDLTGSGSGVITVFLSYNMAKTDELWLSGRQNDGTPSLMWNTDYRSPQTADFIFIAAGKVADTAITGWAKSNNRINIFTKTSMWQYDNANFLPIFEDIGCVSHDTICNNGTFIIWLDATGKVRARDSNAGKDQIISRAVKNKYLNNLTSTNIAQSSAIMYDSNYKLSLGAMTINGTSKITRLVYNFDLNIWWRESHKRRQVLALNSSISGIRRSYFLDENGFMFLDEDTDLDYQDPIPWYIVFGRRTFLSRRILTAAANKTMNGIYVYGSSLSGSQFEIKVPGKDNSWLGIGQLKDSVSELLISDNQVIEGRDFNYRVSGNSAGNAARIEGFEVWFHVRQSKL